MLLRAHGDGWTIPVLDLVQPFDSQNDFCFLTKSACTPMIPHLVKPNDARNGRGTRDAYNDRGTVMRATTKEVW